MIRLYNKLYHTCKIDANHMLYTCRIRSIVSDNTRSISLRYFITHSFLHTDVTNKTRIVYPFEIIFMCE